MSSCTLCEQHTESTFRIEGMCCHTEAATLEQRLQRLTGIHRLSTDVVGQRLRVAYDAAKTTSSTIAEAVAETGMRAWLDQERPAVKRSTGEGRKEIALLLIAAIALTVGMALHAAGAAPAITIALMAVAVVAGGVTTVRRALIAVRNLTLDMYVLMLVAVIGAALIGEWFEAATVVVLFSFAQVLERRSLDRARRAIGALVGVSVSDVCLRRDNVESRVPLDDVRLGDVMLVSPGERIALDGSIITGTSDVNQAPVTGESVPVAKEPGDRLFAGTINGHGALEVQVTAVGDDTTIARIIHLVERAQEQRAPSQAWVDRFAHRYTPIVLILAALVAIVPPLVLAQPFTWWIYRALVLLVIACPCALVLSTPISIVSALAAAARRGVLIKGGIALEKLATLRALALDKTGTLTHGTLTVHDVTAAAAGHTPQHVIATAAALSRRSEHPIARAIRTYAATNQITPPASTALVALPGEGMSGRLEADASGVEVLVGSRRLFEQRGIPLERLEPAVESLQQRGMTTVLVAQGGQAIGVIGLLDEVREHGREAVESLRAEGIRHVALLTGDHRGSAEAAATMGRVDSVESGLLPADKVTAIERLRARYGVVAMVGDGINDAPALAAADVGVAMGVAGTDAAIETADVALMADDLRTLAYVVRLGRRTLRTVQTNVAIALGLKLAFMSLAVAGVATLWMAVVADMGASLIVVGNALRLLRAR